MRDDAASAEGRETERGDETGEGMEGAAGFECANALEGFCFEEETKPWRRRVGGRVVSGLGGIVICGINTIGGAVRAVGRDIVGDSWW
jgi:hypothetical protein